MTNRRDDDETTEKREAGPVIPEGSALAGGPTLAEQDPDYAGTPAEDDPVEPALEVEDEANEVGVREGPDNAVGWTAEDKRREADDTPE